MKEREIDIAHTKILVLISNIQPHFLYDAVDSIGGLCKKNTKTAEEKVLKFSEYLRTNLTYLVSTELVPFEQEKRHTEIYVEMENLRCGHIIHVEYNIFESNFYLPSLTLQPIIENAVRHTINKKESTNPIKVTSEQKENYIEISIEDTGLFLSSSNNKDRVQYLGLENVAERLENFCNGEFIINSTNFEGTKITIRIPITKEEEKK